MVQNLLRMVLQGNIQGELLLASARAPLLPTPSANKLLDLRHIHIMIDTYIYIYMYSQVHM